MWTPEPSPIFSPTVSPLPSPVLPPELMPVRVPVGTVIPYAGPVDTDDARCRLTATGWLPCDGSRLRVSDYPELFAVLQGAYGPVGSKSQGTSPAGCDTWFFLPDYRGYFLRGAHGDVPRYPGSSLDRDPDAASRGAARPQKEDGSGQGNSGDQVGSTEWDAFQGHEHQYEEPGGAQLAEKGTGAFGSDVQTQTTGICPASDFGTPRVRKESRGINIYVNFLIKARSWTPACVPIHPQPVTSRPTGDRAMKELSQAIPLGRAALPRVREHVEAFALLFFDEETQDFTPLEWIEDPVRVRRLHNRIRWQDVDPSPITPLFEHQGFLRLSTGEVFSFRLYDVEEDRPGWLLLTDGHVPLHDGFREAVEEAYSLDHYSSREQSEDYRRREPETEGPFDDGTEPVIPDGPTDGEAGFRVVVYWDNAVSDHNERFAETFRLIHRNSLILAARGPGQVARALSSVPAIRQVIFATHGTEAAFTLGDYGGSIRSANIVGLYPGNTTPTAFGGALKDITNKGATLTLLSCSTAGSTQFEGNTLDGRDLMANLTTGAKDFTLASDRVVFIQAEDATATTDGNVWLSSELQPRGAILQPASPQQLIDLRPI